MGWLGSLWNHAQSLGSLASNVGHSLGSLQQTVKGGINAASNVARDIGNTINNNAENLDSVGLGGAARYVGTSLQSGANLGNSVGNLIGSQNLNEALRNGVDVYKKGVSFAGDVGAVNKIYSPLTKN
jgi:hypothetical protein